MASQTVVGRATIIIDGDARPFDKTVTKAASDTGGRLSAVLGTAAKYGTVALAGLAGAGLLVGVQTAAGMENAKIAFTTMLGSGQKADTFLKQLAAFAAKTPFEFPELQTAASSLISAGINADKVIPIMTTLGDVTSGMGTGAEGVKRATIALQQMNAAGRITGEDLNQLRDAGIPVYDLLAAATGKSKAEIVKLAQAGKLGKTELDAMMKALESGKGLERFSGLMDKQSASLSGLWSTLHDTISQGLAKMITPLIPMLKSVIGFTSDFAGVALPAISNALVVAGKAVADWIQNPQVQEWAQRLIGGAQALAGFVTSTVLPALAKMGQAILGTVVFFNEHKAAAVALGIVVGGVLLAITAAWVTQGAVATLNAAKSVVAWMTTAFASNTAATIQSKSTAQIVAGWLMHAAVAVAQGIRVVATWVLMGAQSLLAAARMAAAWLIAMGPIALVIAAVVALAILIIKNWDTIKAKTIEIWNAVFSWLAGVWNSFTSWATGVWSNIVRLFSGWWTSIKNAVVNTWNAIAAWLSGVWASFTTWLSGVWAGILRVFSAAVTGWKTAIVNTWNAIASWLASVWGTFTSNVATVWGGIYRTISGAWGNVKTTLQSGWTWINSNVFTPLKNGVGALGGAFQSAKDAVTRIWSNLTSSLSGPVSSALKWVQQNLIDRFNSLMGSLGLGLRIPTIWTAPRVAPGGRMGGGWAGGGYTGNMDPKKVAGFVHGKEWVLNAKSTGALIRDYGVGFLNALNGYASGGWVAPVHGVGPAFPWGHYPSGGYHPALDYPVPTGTPVYAPAAGSVAKAGWDPTGYGNSVFLNHGNGLFSVLGHLLRTLVSTGAFVKQSQLVGISDSTGRSTGPHVHWGVMSGGIYGRGVNPGSVGPGGGGGGGNFISNFIGEQLRNGLHALTGGVGWLGDHLGPMGGLVGGMAKKLIDAVGSKAISMMGFGEGGGRTGVSFDQGGWLRPGWNPPSYNGTGAPEPVGWGQAGITVNMTVSVDDLAKLGSLAEFLTMIEKAPRTDRKTARSGRVSA